MMQTLNTNYHTHTKRCNHAFGEDREYVEAAIENGFTVLGFSDHVPWPECSPGVAHSRMAWEMIDDYFNSLTTLKAEYRDELELHIGFEAENFDEIEELTRLLEPYPCEYLLLGHHYNTIGEDSVYYGRPFSRPELLEQYVSRVVAGIQSGRFLYVAHPDLPNFQGDSAVWQENMARICTAASAAGVPLEVNALGLRTNRNYPNADFFRMAAEAGCTLCIGLDAHNPKDLQDQAGIARTVAFAESFHAPIRTLFPL